jgi:DNA-binding response OmpR family regulator
MTKILIVDDDEMIRLMYQKIFVFNNFDAEIAADGEEGVQKAQSLSPDLVLLDVMMPKLTGLQVLEKLKADEKTKNIPVVMLTSLDGQQDAKEALSKGAVRYIVKSEYEPKEVAVMVKEVLDGYNGKLEVIATPDPSAPPQL